jgi:tRNA threonylcarbamoyladenosine biosynthesis protein TsaE
VTAGEVEVVAATPEQTRALGERLAGLLRAGDLVILTGGLGSGKTTFTQGLGAGLRVRGDVTSPTFVISRVHPPLGGGPALVHVDAYRLAGSTGSGQAALTELDDLDLDTSLEEAVTVVEWGEGLAEDLADARLEVTLTLADACSEARRLSFRPVGERWRAADLPGALA